ncbi:MAG: M48 family metallopeptidase [Cytophagaceae bacterium]|nr:M48 family metallopeptidase [Cytophagaceae bacterium]
MKRTIFMIFSVLTLPFFDQCSSVPDTGRKQLDLVPHSQVLSMSNTSYKDFLSQNKLSSNTEQTAMVKRVGQRLATAVEQYLKSQNSKELKDYSWEFNLVESPEVNAFCMPGGKVVVYTGILPVTGDETGLAVVLGHEIAHAVANHGNERLSQGLIQQLGGVALQVALNDKPQQTKNLFLSAYGAGTTVGIMLPYSRAQESEADHLGLSFMAMAGYNPQAAVGFWQRMAAQSSGQKPPELLSTHPSDEKRIADIQKSMDEAMKYYNTSGKQ